MLKNQSLTLTCCLLISVLFCSCSNHKEKEYQAAFAKLGAEHFKSLQYSIFERNFEKNDRLRVYYVFKEVIDDLDKYCELRDSKKAVISLSDSLNLRSVFSYDDSYCTRLERCIENLQSNNVSPIEEIILAKEMFHMLLYDNSFCNFGAYPKGELKAFFKDTLYLSKDSDYKFPLAYYIMDKGSPEIPTVMSHDISYEAKHLPVATHKRNVGDGFSIPVAIKAKNVITGEPWVIRDTFQIKIVK